jgi:hypothetical protein
MFELLAGGVDGGEAPAAVQATSTETSVIERLM